MLQVKVKRKRNKMENELKKNIYTDEEITMIKSLFGGDNGLKNLKLLRKIFAPEYDSELPIGRSQEVILWQNLDQLTSMAPADREIAILSQIKLTRHIESNLQTLHFMANRKEETFEELEKRMKKDSTK
jgi:hypothetical protein